VPVILNGGAETEGLDIAVGYDRNMLEVTDVTLAGGILEHEGYRLVANTGDGHIRIAVFAVSENLFTGDGAILFISFTIHNSQFTIHNSQFTSVSHLLHIFNQDVFSLIFCSVPEFMKSATSADKYFIA